MFNLNINFYKDILKIFNFTFRLSLEIDMINFYFLYPVINELFIVVYSYDSYYKVNEVPTSIFDVNSVNTNFSNELLFTSIMLNASFLPINNSNLKLTNDFSLKKYSNISMNKTNETSSLSYSILDELEDIFNVYYLPTIVIIGIIGNLLTIIILSQENNLLQLYSSHYAAQTAKRNDTLIDRRNDTLIDRKNDTLIEPSKKSILAKSASMKDILNAALSQEKKKINRQRFSPTNYFIFSLAISDLFYNLILLLVWITNMNVNMLNHNYVCQLSIFITYICSFLSAAFTTLFTFQRFMAVVKPLRSATSFSLQSTRFIRRLIIFLIIFSSIIYSFSFFLYDANLKKLHESQPIQLAVCGIKEGYKQLVLTLDNTIDAFFTLIIPAISIFCMNIAICKSLTNYHKDNILNEQSSSYRMSSNLKKSPKKTIAEEPESYHNTQIESIKREFKKNHNTKESVLSENLQKYSHFKIEVVKNKENGTHRTSWNSNEAVPNDKSPRRAKNQKQDSLSVNENKSLQTAASRRVTKTLLVVSFTFLILNSPYRTANLISFIIMSINDKYEYNHIEYVINLVLLRLYFTSYSLNFFLYSLWGKKFRASLKALFFNCFFVIYKKIQNISRNILKRK